MTKIYLSVVIPAYNEETNIRLGALEKVAKYFSKFKKSWEIIIVNDGSNDLTEELVTEFIKENKNFHLVNNSHLGKAYTVVKGINNSIGENVLFTDLDQATPISQLEKLLPYIENNYPIVIGSRSDIRQGAPLLRRIMAKGFIILRSIVLGLGEIKDTQCGFKLFSKKASDQIFSKLKLYSDLNNVSGPMVTAGFDIEVLYIAKKLGYKIKEVPVEWHYVETRRVSPLLDSIRGLRDIFRIKYNAIRGKYN